MSSRQIGFSPLHMYKLKQLIRRGVHGIGLAVILFWSLFPIYWILVFSFRQVGNDFDFSILPQYPTLDNYRLVFTQSPLINALFNSTVVGISTVAIASTVGVWAAYAIARVDFRGKQILVYGLLLLYALPAISFITGLYQLLNYFQWIDTLHGLILCYTMFLLPFAVWLLSSFIQSLPYELEEAAQMDGYSPLSIIFHVVVPLLKPALASYSILAFIACWNEFLFALTFVYTESLKTVPLMVSYFSIPQYVDYTPFTVISASCVVAMLPIVVILFIGYRYIVSGLTTGALKG